MAKKTWINISGVWTEVKNVWVNVGGVWREKVIPKGSIIDTWKEFIQYIKKLITAERLMVVPSQIISDNRDGEINIYDDYIEFYKPAYASGNIWRGVITGEMVDLKDYQKLTLNYQYSKTNGSGNIILVVTLADTNSFQNRTTDYIAYTSNNVPSLPVGSTDVFSNTITLDISELTGYYNVAVTYRNTSSSNNFVIQLDDINLE